MNSFWAPPTSPIESLRQTIIALHQELLMVDGHSSRTTAFGQKRTFIPLVKYIVATIAFKFGASVQREKGRIDES